MESQNLKSELSQTFKSDHTKGANESRYDAIEERIEGILDELEALHSEIKGVRNEIPELQNRLETNWKESLEMIEARVKNNSKQLIDKNCSKLKEKIKPIKSLKKADE